MVVTKSPLTGAIANSNAGGQFPAELKFAGYDLIIFEGKAKKPVYLWIENEKVAIRSAEALWGMDTYQTQQAICAETDEYAKVACIGPKTADAATKAGLKVDIVASAHTIPGLVAAIEEYFRKETRTRYSLCDEPSCV